MYITNLLKSDRAKYIFVCLVAFMILAAIITDIYACTQNPKYSSYSDAYTNGTASDAIKYAAENDLFLKLGFEAENADKISIFEEARNVFTIADGEYTYMYYIGNKSGVSFDFITFAFGKNKIEEGRGIISCECEEYSIEIVTYYFRREYLIKFENDKIHTSALVTDDFTPCRSQNPRVSYKDNYDLILQYVDQTTITDLISEYNTYTKQMLDDLHESSSD